MPPAVGYAIAGIATGIGMLGSAHSNRKAAREAGAVESRYSDQALADARTERERTQRLEEEDRRRLEENRAYDRAQLEREFGYRSGRDAISDARFNDERDFTRTEFSGYKSRLAPFSNAGTRATANLSSVVGRSLPAAIPTAGAGGMVRLQSPTGQISEVPAQHAEHYLKLGAKQV